MISFILIFAKILVMSMFQISGSGGQDDPLPMTPGPTISRNPPGPTCPLGLPLIPTKKSTNDASLLGMCGCGFGSGIVT